jgi:hypothetical protein
MHKFYLTGVQVFDLIRDGLRYRGVEMIRGSAVLRKDRFEDGEWHLSGLVEEIPKPKE